MKEYTQDFEYVKNLDLEKYFYENGLSEVIGVDNYTRPEQEGPNDTYEQEGEEIFEPDCPDLCRLHAIVRRRKVLTVLEFGSGVSTKVIAHALSLNQQQYEKDISLIRRQSPFKIYSVEAEREYADTTLRNSGVFKKYIEMHVSSACQTSFNGRVCGRYENLPSVCPDLIYIDGPSPYSYNNSLDAYISMAHPDITNITCDLLMMEQFLLPGTFVIFDGMTSNSRFNRQHLYRDWISVEDTEMDYTMLVLDEEPIGLHHKNQINFINT
jgi:hypothetical protein